MILDTGLNDALSTNGNGLTYSVKVFQKDRLLNWSFNCIWQYISLFLEMLLLGENPKLWLPWSKDCILKILAIKLLVPDEKK